MTRQTIDLTKLIFFGWTVWPAMVKKLFFFLPRLLSKDIIAVVLYFMYIWHFLHVQPYFRKTSWLYWNIWPLIVPNYSGYARLPQPLIFGAFFFSLNGCGFHQWILRQECLLNSSCMLVTIIFHFRWVIEFFLQSVIVSDESLVELCAK